MSDLSWSLFSGRVASLLRQPIARAVAIAAALTIALAVAVLAVWTVDPGTGNDDESLTAPILSDTADPDAPTPTPRVIAIRPTPAATEEASGPAPTPTTGAVGGASRGEATAESTETGTTPTADEADAPDIAAAPTNPPPTEPAPDPTSRPEPTSTPKPTVPATPDPLYLARDADDLAAWASGSWTVAEDQLVYEVATNNAEPWTVSPFRPEGDAYAVEVEARVRSTDPAVQCQSFGVLTAEGQTAVRGAGVLFPCKGQPMTARLSDLTAWNAGYFETPELAAEPFDPGDAWHTYRLEVRGRELRLLIDGEELVEATAPAVAPGGSDAEIGLWSQGVRIGVRRIAVLPLDGDAGE